MGVEVVHRQVHSWLLHECREMGGEIPLGARFADVCTLAVPVATLKLAMRVQVPWRVYSNSLRFPV